MENNEQHAIPEHAVAAPTDTAVPSEPAKVRTPDSSHAPRYGAMSYGGVQTTQPVQEN